MVECKRSVLCRRRRGQACGPHLCHADVDEPMGVVPWRRLHGLCCGSDCSLPSGHPCCHIAMKFGSFILIFSLPLDLSSSREEEESNRV